MTVEITLRNGWDCAEISKLINALPVDEKTKELMEIQSKTYALQSKFMGKEKGR